MGKAAWYHGGMENTKTFRIDTYRLDARLGRLSADQREAMERALALYESGSRHEGGPSVGERLTFLLPLAQFGLGADLLVRLMLSVPEDWPWDHRQIYYDFRLGRWMKHIEPPTFGQCLEEYFENAETPEAALRYLGGEWDRFLRRHS